jgi:hypothetical protein
MEGTRWEGDGAFYWSGLDGDELERRWGRMVDGEKMKDGRGGWRAPGVHFREVRCKKVESNGVGSSMGSKVEYLSTYPRVAFA